MYVSAKYRDEIFADGFFFFFSAVVNRVRFKFRNHSRPWWFSIGNFFFFVFSGRDLHTDGCFLGGICCPKISRRTTQRQRTYRASNKPIRIIVPIQSYLPTRVIVRIMHIIPLRDLHTRSCRRRISPTTPWNVNNIVERYISPKTAETV